MLSDLLLNDFLAKTASDAPVPGGGSVAALSGALAAALARMVANLTVGKKGFDDVCDEMRTIAEQAAGLQAELVAAIDRDAQAFEQVMVAFRMPKATTTERAARTEAIQEGLKEAARVPLGVAQQAMEAMELAGRALTRGNRNAVTDGAVGVMMARTAVLGALYNVKINLDSIRDTAFVEDLTSRVTELESHVKEREQLLLTAVAL